MNLPDAPPNCRLRVTGPDRPGSLDGLTIHGSVPVAVGLRANIGLLIAIVGIAAGATGVFLMMVGLELPGLIFLGLAFAIFACLTLVPTRPEDYDYLAFCGDTLEVRSGGEITRYDRSQIVGAEGVMNPIAERPPINHLEVRLRDSSTVEVMDWERLEDLTWAAACIRAFAGGE